MKPDPGSSRTSTIGTKPPALTQALTACLILPQSAIITRAPQWWTMKIGFLTVLYRELEARVVQRGLAERIDGMIRLGLQIPASIQISIEVHSTIPLFTSNLPRMLMTLLMRYLILRTQRNRDMSRRILQCILPILGILHRICPRTTPITTILNTTDILTTRHHRPGTALLREMCRPVYHLTLCILLLEWRVGIPRLLHRQTLRHPQTSHTQTPLHRCRAACLRDNNNRSHRPSNNSRHLFRHLTSTQLPLRSIPRRFRSRTLILLRRNHNSSNLLHISCHNKVT